MNISISRDRGFLVYTNDAGLEFYDPPIPSISSEPDFLSHMRRKRWFTMEVEIETVRLISEYWVQS